MQAISQDQRTLSIPLGQRRGVSDLAQFALDLTRAKQRAESGEAARPRAYPSPPMSGSPPLPPNTNQDAGNRASLYASYPASLHDAYRAGPPQATHNIGALPTAPSRPPPAYQSEPPERLGFPYNRPEDPFQQSSATYPPGVSQSLHPRPPHYVAMTGPHLGPGPLPPPPQGFAPAMQPQPIGDESGSVTSPKSQRKTKGHVASACVPCKKAHLRCDARRPCSRCQSNGKEDACIDVQHKKRGRPRLRNDSDSRYGASTYPHPQDAAIRRPLSLYSPGIPVSGESAGPRYLERATAADANIYAAPLTVGTVPPEPVAFLNLNLEIVKASPTFADAVGSSNIRGRTLFELVAHQEVSKIQRHLASMQEERSRKDPMYLPPIFGKEHVDRVFDTFRFDVEEVSRLPLDRHDALVFVANDGQRRQLPVRFGSAKRDSIYFVAMALNISPGYQYSSPSPHGREVPYNWAPQGVMQAHHPHPPPYGHHATTLASGFDGRQRFETAMDPRPVIGPAPHVVAGPSSSSSNVGSVYSPGVAATMASYAASPSRPEYAVGPSSSQIPRSELPAASQPLQQRQSQYQLPPIRSPPPTDHVRVEQPVRRDERSGRVDIGGLIDKPDQPARK